MTNVHASAEHLQAMYAHALSKLVRLKRLVDLDGTLRNEFLERVFPAHFPPPRLVRGATGARSRSL